MSKPARSISLTLVFSMLINFICFAQGDEGVKKKEFKNTISYNISNYLIFGSKAYVLSYERVVGKHQSFSVEFGRFSIPEVSILPSSITANKESTEKGYKIGADYRFYPASENKYNAPRGIYFAPYFSYNHFNRKKSFNVGTDSTSLLVNTDFTLNIGSVGLQMGYQFVFWNRLALDLVLLGPGISRYSIKAKLDTSLDPDKESELFKAINDALAEKIPGYNRIISSEEFSKTGSANTTSFGFRYLVHLGFRF